MAIRSLADLRGSGEDSPNENGATNSFSGGERSGLAIQNPSSAFPNATVGAAPPGARRVSIYKNGFRVDEGEFRPFGVEENDHFVQELKAGVAPRELQQGGRQVHVLLDDRHEETYTPPAPPQYVLFGGEGQSLSGDRTSPNHPAGAAAAAAVDVSLAAAAAAAAAPADPSAPRTQILFRFHDGQRTAQHFPTSATVQQLFDFVERVAPAPGGFSLLEGFPPRPLSAARSATLQEAGLLNATLSQKLS
ncbi:UBX domain-containing protein, putative [Eimeria tenella]|uniref:UBX domain-containing protein, putative n=1 Tax=Eimeria tenella TaxID=5802 RepID=U6KSP0_EIMTE|nr:UBX domain-containing protein, putative [Eimeria tenella]CDJ39923.1 UBX domain-containing protein, putative [Eimeria tenella]|eukprot:XP_013230676.1 UBX domain-containing protein, putative [Eimeria tenella]